MAGHVEPRSWLEESSIFVLPSFYREGVPRSIQEAMAMEMPIITSTVPGCRDTVEEGKRVSGATEEPAGTRCGYAPAG